MGERRIWKIIFWTLIVTGLLVLVVNLDPGFLSTYIAAIPVSTGERVEVLVSRISPLRSLRDTDLYWLERDGSFRKVASFEQPLRCVTGLDGKLFITFEDGKSSFFADGEWVRGVSGPHDLDIIDVVGYEGRIYAFGASDDNRKITVASLGDQGWRVDFEPFDAAKEIRFRGCIDVAGGIEVLYAAGPVDFAGRVDLENTRWYHVFFDGEKWGEEKPLEVPQRVVVLIAAWEGRLAALLLPTGEKAPIQLALVKDGELEIATNVAVPTEGQILSAWLVSLDGSYRAVLVGAGSLWEVPIADLKAGPPKLLAEISSASKLRSGVYVAVLGVAAVLLVSLGATWLRMRVRAMRQARRG